MPGRDAATCAERVAFADCVNSKPRRFREILPRVLAVFFLDAIPAPGIQSSTIELITRVGSLSMSSIISRSEWAVREDKVLHLREIVPQFWQTKTIGFSPNKLRLLDRTAAKIEHDGCINIVKWHQSGSNFLTGSDDRNIKLWSLTNDLENVLLKHTMCTRHRGNIFYVDFSPIDGNVVYSVAADGTLRSNHLNQRNAGELLRTSTDMM